MSSTQSLLSAIWDSLLIPREVHALIKHHLTAQEIDTSMQIIDAAEICTDIDYVYIALAKLSPSIAKLILPLTADIRDSICIYYIFARTIDIISEDPDLTPEKQIELLSQFVPTIQTNPQWSLEGVGSTDNARQLLHTFPKVLSFRASLPTKYINIIDIFVQKTVDLQIDLLRAGIAAPQISTTNNEGLSTAPVVSNEDAQLYGQFQFINDSTEKPSINPKKFQISLQSIKDYNDYCMLTNGLMFQCYDELFQASGLMLHKFEEYDSAPLAASLGMFVQKASIIRNYTRDILQQRLLWPAEIWAQYSTELNFFLKYPLHVRSRLCLNHMILDAMHHGLDSIKYLSIIQHHQPTFTFVAMQVVLAFGVLSHLYNNNADLFNANRYQFSYITIRPGLVCDLLLNCTSYPIAKGYIFKLLQDYEIKGGLDPQHDTYYLNPTITREEVKKAVSIHQQLKLLIMSCRDACLGYYPISAGWGGLCKAVVVTASIFAALKWLTDYNILWDAIDDEPALYLDPHEMEKLHLRNKAHAKGTTRGPQETKLHLRSADLEQQHHDVERIMAKNSSYFPRFDGNDRDSDNFSASRSLEQTERLLERINSDPENITADEIEEATNAIQNELRRITSGDDLDWELRTQSIGRMESPYNKPSGYRTTDPRDLGRHFEQGKMDLDIAALENVSDDEFMTLIRSKFS